MPEPAGLVLERGDKAGMGVAEGGHGDPAAEVQEPPPVGREEVGALAFLESDVPIPVGRHQGGDHDRVSFGWCFKHASPPQAGGEARNSGCRARLVNAPARACRQHMMCPVRFLHRGGTRTNRTAWLRERRMKTFGDMPGGFRSVALRSRPAGRGKPNALNKGPALCVLV